jgi:hypothetical protein
MNRISPAGRCLLKPSCSVRNQYAAIRRPLSAKRKPAGSRFAIRRQRLRAKLQELATKRLDEKEGCRSEMKANSAAFPETIIRLQVTPFS